MMKGIDECTYEQFEYALRVGNPDDIAELILFLCSDKATFITGENICADTAITPKTKPTGHPLALSFILCS